VKQSTSFLIFESHESFHLDSFTTLIFVLPIVCCFGMHFGVGGRLKHLSLGIVNDEVGFVDRCSNRSLVSVEVVGFMCTVKRASCRFIDELQDDFAEKV
jgi:hypothetical protein